MINKPTVFVIGAGASAEFGLPSGVELKDRVAAGVRFRFERGSNMLIAGEETLLSVLRNKFRSGQHFDHEKVSEYTRAGNELAETMATFPSIDEALHWWRARPEIVELGKLAIAHYIMAAEQSSPLARKERPAIDIDNVSGTWLQPFMSIALSARERDDVVNAFENVTLINFNYDRTVEQYLLFALQQRAGVSEELATESCSRLRVIRPYGSIGKLDWQVDTGGVAFGGWNYGGDLAAIANSIRTFTEQVSHPDILTATNKALTSAALVIFLGFGFHQQNLTWLRKPPAMPPRKANTVMATVLGIDERNFPALNDQFAMLDLFDPMLVPLRAAQLLEKLRPTISMAVA